MKLSLKDLEPGTLSQIVDELTRHRVLESLTALQGSLEGAQLLWAQCCERAQCPLVPESFDQLDRIAQELSALQGPISLVGSSLAIRINTYRLLEKTRRLEAFLMDGENKR